MTVGNELLIKSVECIADLVYVVWDSDEAHEGFRQAPVQKHVVSTT